MPRKFPLDSTNIALLPVYHIVEVDLFLRYVDIAYDNFLVFCWTHVKSWMIKNIRWVRWFWEIPHFALFFLNYIYTERDHTIHSSGELFMRSQEGYFCVYSLSCSNEGNKHQNNPLVSALAVHQSILFIIIDMNVYLYVAGPQLVKIKTSYLWQWGK